MRLALSSAAAPDAPLQELLDACARRGLHALELEEGHGHGIDSGIRGDRLAADIALRARAAGVTLAGLRLALPVPEDETPLLALAAALDAPILVPLHPHEAGAGAAGAGAGAALKLVHVLRENGAPVRAVLAAGFDPSRLRDLPPDLPLAWDADPSLQPLDRAADALLGDPHRRLGHIRLMGGGPEATRQEGRGVGRLMARLALAGFVGTVALAPSSGRYRVIWDAWLGRRGGWGCGSRAEDRSLVSLAAREDA